MIFSSPEFIMLFLPVVFLVYFSLNKFRFSLAGKAWLVLASLYFYSYWSIEYLPLLVGSICGNFAFGYFVRPGFEAVVSEKLRKWLLILSVSANLVLLAYYKYFNFFVDNFNAALGVDVGFLSIALPLGISFYTFTQIAFLVDSYRGKVADYSFLNYALFVTFFPHLIAGPILHHFEMMSQFQSRWRLFIRYRNILLGLMIFSIGLFKKVVLADTFAIWADAGYSATAVHDFYSSWATSLSYTFQLYFDFSGYCDMAVGAGLLFNIWLPINFNSPYKSLDIQDFWRRWHMTLSRYLRDYLYIPLGGNRGSEMRVYFNLFTTFLLGGLWHGASWMFVIWGALHGIALIIHRIWRRLGLCLPNAFAWVVTFLFVNITWVFFRAPSVDAAWKVLRGMVDFSSISSITPIDVPTKDIAWGGVLIDDMFASLPATLVQNMLCFMFVGIALTVITQRNSFEFITTGRIGTLRIGFCVALFCLAMYSVMASTSTVFLYFNF